MKDDREFQVGQPKKTSTIQKVGAALVLAWFGLMLFSSVITWVTTSPCDRAGQDLARLQEKRSKWVQEGNLDMLQATYEDLQKAESNSSKSCAK